MKKSSFFCRSSFFILILFLFTNCQSKKPAQETLALKRPAHAEKGNLTLEQAQQRSQLISNPQYALHLLMDKRTDSFEGTVNITFDLAKVSPAVFLDFRSGGFIDSLQVNGVLSKDFVYDDGHISLPQSLLRLGANSIQISYHQKYSKDGTGLYRFSDPEDHEVYFYTQFETYDANQMFPCFDQPDLKARLQLTVDVPGSWQVISTMREASIKPAKKHHKVWTFPQTPALSTYLFSLHAGPYAHWSSKAGKIPLRLFVRRSLKKYVTPRDWFTPTIQGLKFYGDYFGYPYPFLKYDQVIVPDFNAGAMENVAAVTFTEYFVRRGKITTEQREGLANVILHEMAHMWFGDLVTMKWWDGLWLNESFATYMSSLSSSHATEFKDAWINFFESKNWAYVEDQRSITHPIQAVVPDTDSALANFDAITYAKGASVLKQLSFYLGEDKFREGLHQYFQTNAYKNAKIQDFIHALEKSSGQDLSVWSHSWFESAGLDTVQVRYSCKENKISQFDLLLKAPEGQKEIRTHRTQIGLFKSEKGQMSLQKTQDVAYSGPLTSVASLIGSDCPEMVYPNLNDYDYVKVQLDAKTLAAAKESLSDIKDNFTRILFWPNLYSMVRDSQLSPQEYLRIVEKNLPKEKNLKIGLNITQTLPVIIDYLPQQTPADKKFHQETLQKFEQLLWNKMLASAPGSDWQKSMFDSYVRVAQTPQAMENLGHVLAGKIKLRGFTLDPDRRWSVIILLSSANYPKAEMLLDAERDKDKSERAVQSSLAAEASFPTLENKKKWLDKINSVDFSFARTRSILWHFLPISQTDLRASLSDQFYRDIVSYSKTRDAQFLTTYTWAMMPIVCSNQSAERLDQFIQKESAQLPPLVVKALKTGWEEDVRCSRIRAQAHSLN